MDNNTQGTNWLAVGLIFFGCFVISLAIGRIMDDATWAGIGIGVGLVIVGIMYALGNRK